MKYVLALVLVLLVLILIGWANVEPTSISCEQMDLEARAECYSDLIKTKANPDLCVQIQKDPELRGVFTWSCYRELSKLAEDASDCLEIPEGINRDNCFFTIRECEKIVDPGIANSCKAALALENEEESYCDELGYGFFQFKCKAQATDNISYCNTGPFDKNTPRQFEEDHICKQCAENDLPESTRRLCASDVCWDTWGENPDFEREKQNCLDIFNED